MLKVSRSKIGILSFPNLVRTQALRVVAQVSLCQNAFVVGEPVAAMYDYPAKGSPVPMTAETRFESLGIQRKVR